jgi:transposase-like protein
MSQKSKHRSFSKEFRAEALRRLQGTANVSELCRKVGISRQLLHLWKQSAEKAVEKGSMSSEQRGLRRENLELKKVLVQRTLEGGFFQDCLAKKSRFTARAAAALA